MNEFDSEREYIRRVYQNGWYSFVVTITFKPNLPYCSLHPKKAHELFGKIFTTYTKARGMNYYLCPELSSNGNLHYHGLVFLKGGNFNAFEKQYKLFKNWMNRKFGRNYCQRIYNFYDEYKTENIKRIYGNKECKTSFDKIWTYIHKDQVVERRFSFLDRMKYL